MKVIYAKTILYAYPKFDMLLDVFDDLAEKKAISAFGDTRPCDELGSEILEITAKKDEIVKLRVDCDFIINRLSQEERTLLDYKYFKEKPIETYSLVDVSDRNYYRKQIRLATKFGVILGKIGYTDAYFEDLCNRIHFFGSWLKVTKERERAMQKNKNCLKSKEKSVPQERISYCA